MKPTKKQAKRLPKSINGLIRKWELDLLSYPELMNENARYAAGLLRLCIKELRQVGDNIERRKAKGKK